MKNGAHDNEEGTKMDIAQRIFGNEKRYQVIEHAGGLVIVDTQGNDYHTQII